MLFIRNTIWLTEVRKRLDRWAPTIADKHVVIKKKTKLSLFDAHAKDKNALIEKLLRNGMREQRGLRKKKTRRKERNKGEGVSSMI